ncbi:MAG: glycosyltransferase family 39 protein [Pseudomonadota bacterium]|nr:glycosyltransferase family 39 protein [Pseudomonadota bacterium]
MRDSTFRFLAWMLVAFALWLRVQHCYDGLPYLHFWDEPQTASTALVMLRSGDFDPHFFNYGSLMIYLDLLVDAAHALSLLGSPTRAGESLLSVGEVVVNADTGWHWTISHPSFYFWNRVLVAVMGALTVGLVAGIGRRLVGAAAGLVGAGLLTALPVHIEESSRVGNDAPVAFFVLLGTWCALRFLEEEEPRWLLGSLVGCGLAISCKYNAGMSLIIPLVALVVASLGGRPAARAWLWPAAIVVPAAAFLATTPYALIDLPDFLDQVGYELRHYKVLGHGISTVTPGWPNLEIQLLEAWRNLGPIPSLACVVGVFVALGRRSGWIVWLFPVVYGAYMSNTRISFPRNFLVIYPFLCLACAFTYGALEGRIPLRFSRIVRWFWLGGALVWLGSALPAAWDARRPETRSEMVSLLRASSWTRIGIPEELRVHAIDLARLSRKDVLVAPLAQLLCGSDREVVVVPVTFVSAADPLEVERLNRLLPPIEAAVLHGAAGAGTHALDQPSLNPQLRLVPPTPSAGACVAVEVSASALLRPPEFPVEAGVLHVLRAGTIMLPSRPFPAGTWEATWLLRGTPAGGIAPLVRLEARSAGALLYSADVPVGADWGGHAVRIELPAPAEVELTLDFTNDDVVEGEDRNVEVRGVRTAPL